MPPLTNNHHHHCAYASPEVEHQLVHLVLPVQHAQGPHPRVEELGVEDAEPRLARGGGVRDALGEGARVCGVCG